MLKYFLGAKIVLCWSPAEMSLNSNFSRLPDGVLNLIFSHLHPTDRTQARAICKQIKRVIDENVKVVKRDFWRHMESLSLPGLHHPAALWVMHKISQTRDLWPSLQVLDLTSMQISDVEMIELANCRWKSLQILLLGQNRITAVGAQALARGNATSWPNIRKLDLNRNLINDSALLKLMSETWWHLEILDLSCCQLTLTEKTLKQPNNTSWHHIFPALQRLSLARNPFKGDYGAVLAAIKCPLIEELSLKGANLSAEQMATIAAAGYQWLSLKSLDLGNLGDNIEDYRPGDDLARMFMQMNTIGPSGAASLAAALPYWQGLQKLILYKTRIGIEGIRHLSKANLVNLEELDLGVCEIGPDGAAVLANGLWRWPIRKLNLEGNNLEDTGLWRLIIPASTKVGIEELNLAGNMLSCNGVWALLAHVGLNLPTTLRKVNLSGNYLGPDGATALLKRPFYILESLNLFRTGLGIQGVGAIALSGSYFPKLRQLYLGCNLMGGNAETPIQFLSWSNLEVLSLATNDIGPDFARKLAKSKSAGELPALVELNLFNNRLGCAGVNDLLKTTWGGLRTLNLCNNRVEGGGAAVLALAAKEKLPSLETLQLGSNCLGDGGAEALTVAVWENLAVLNVTGNSIGPRGALALATMAAHFPRLRVLNIAENCLGCLGATYIARAPWKSPVIDYNGISTMSLDLIKELNVQYDYCTDSLNEVRTSTRTTISKSSATCTLDEVKSSQLSSTSTIDSKNSRSQHWPMLELIVVLNNSIGRLGMIALNETQKCRPTLKILA